MKFTRKHAFIVLGAAYLIITTGLAIYTSIRSATLALPVRNLSITTAIWPSISMILHRASQYKKLPWMNTIIIAITSVLFTLLANQPAACLYRDRWTSLFHNKDNIIAHVQELLSCCGFSNSRDMSWPFPDRLHGPNACEIALGRTNGCQPAWIAEEHRLSVVLIAVVAAVALWQLTVNFYPEHQPWPGTQSATRSEPHRIQYDEYTDAEAQHDSQPLVHDSQN